MIITLTVQVVTLEEELPMSHAISVMGKNGRQES